MHPKPVCHPCSIWHWVSMTVIKVIFQSHTAAQTAVFRVPGYALSHTRVCTAACTMKIRKYQLRHQSAGLVAAACTAVAIGPMGHDCPLFQSSMQRRGALQGDLCLGCTQGSSPNFNSQACSLSVCLCVCVRACVRVVCVCVCTCNQSIPSSSPSGDAGSLEHEAAQLADLEHQAGPHLCLCEHLCCTALTASTSISHAFGHCRLSG